MKPSRDALSFRQQTGQPLIIWGLLALLAFLTQIIFRHELAPGQFGTLNTVLGIMGLMTLPLVALRLGFVLYFAQEFPDDRRDHVTALRAAVPTLIDSAVWAWGIASIFIMIFTLPHLGMPSFGVGVFTLLNVLILLASFISAAHYQQKDRVLVWSCLLLTAALIRIFVGSYLAARFPEVEAALTTFVIGGLILLKPLFSQESPDFNARLKAYRAVLDPAFLRHLTATASIVLTLFLFTNADRIVAQSWFGRVDQFNFGFINWGIFDGYQTAGLLGRAILWGTQPLLLMFYAQRAPLTRTTPASLKYFWIYLAALLTGAFLLSFFQEPAAHLFCGPDTASTLYFIPSFAIVVVPLGVLQGLAVFALASKRQPECLFLGTCSIAYFLLLYSVGRQPELMISYIFGGASATIFAVVFMGIVRWGRLHP